MKRRTDTQTASRVYTYGSVPTHRALGRGAKAASAGVIGEEQALHQLYLANRLWNLLVVIDRDRTARYRRIMHDEQQERIQALKKQIEGWRTEIQSRRQQARKRAAVDVEDLRTQIAAAKAEQHALIEDRKVHSKERHEAKQPELQALEALVYKRITRARQAAARMGLFWGTYNDIVQRADAGRKLGDLQFRRFTGEGTLTAQIMGGALVDRCIGGQHTFFKVDKPGMGRPRLDVERQGFDEAKRRAIEQRISDRRLQLARLRADIRSLHQTLEKLTATPHELLGAAKSLEVARTAKTRLESNNRIDSESLFLRGATQRWQYAHMRIGSTAERQPVWLSIPIVFHRPLPANGMIKSVSMSRRLTPEGKAKWQLNVTVTLPQPESKPGPTIAVDIGWRLLIDGIRLACWESDTGESGQVLVSHGDVAEILRVRELVSTCKQMHNEFLPGLAAWVDGAMLTEEWRKQSSHLIQWKSGDRLARLIDWWRLHRLPEDGDIFIAAQTWRKQYLHLAHWWRNLQQQMVLRLREQYRVFAVETARKYGTIIIEDFDLREVLQKRPAETAERDPINHIRQLVAPGTFRMALVNACQREGVQVVKVPAMDTTRLHWRCQLPLSGDAAKDVVLHCDACQEDIDQDENAAKNLLASGRPSSMAVA